MNLISLLVVVTSLTTKSIVADTITIESASSDSGSDLAETVPSIVQSSSVDYNWDADNIVGDNSDTLHDESASTSSDEELEHFEVIETDVLDNENAVDGVFDVAVQTPQPVNEMEPANETLISVGEEPRPQVIRTSETNSAQRPIIAPVRPVNEAQVNMHHTNGHQTGYPYHLNNLNPQNPNNQNGNAAMQDKNSLPPPAKTQTQYKNAAMNTDPEPEPFITNATEIPAPPPSEAPVTKLESKIFHEREVKREPKNSKSSMTEPRNNLLYILNSEILFYSTLAFLLFINGLMFYFFYFVFSSPRDLPELLYDPEVIPDISDII